MGYELLKVKIIFVSETCFTLGVRANVQPKSSIPIGAKVEISPKGFILGVKVKLEKIFSIFLKLLINAEFYGLVFGPKSEKRISSNLGYQFATLGANVRTFINILAFINNSRLNNKPKILKVGPKFL